MMPSQKLTKSFVDRVTSTTGDTFYWDLSPKGFGLKISPSGNKSFVVQYRLSGGRSGRTRRLTIGKYGSPWTVDTARREATRILSAVTSGSDPASDREEQRLMLTVAQLCDLYMEKGTGTKKPSTLSTDRGRIERHIKPLLGRRKLNEIGRNDIVRFQSDVAAGVTAIDKKTGPRGRSIVRGGKGTASRTLGLLGAIFTYAVDEKLIDQNPAHGVKKFRDNRRDRFLAPNEFSILGETLRLIEAEGANANALAIIRLLMLTGARKGEIENLKWKEIDLVSRYLRLDDSKTGQKQIPLNGPAIRILQRHEALLGRNSEYVFCSSGSLSPYRGTPKIWSRVRDRSGLVELRLHDLRHSFASLGLAQGSALSILGSLLGHRHSGTTQRYAHLSEDPVRAASEKIGAEISLAIDTHPPE